MPQGDQFKKVRSGDPLRIPAAAYNAFIDAAEAHKRDAKLGGEARWSLRRGGVVRVRNDSGADCGRFAVLGIDRPIILPTDNHDAFAAQVALSCITPATGGTGDEHAGRFVVLLEPLADGKIGFACAAGVCPVKVDVADEAHGFAEIADGDATKLASGETGSATILWKEAGAGEKWAVIRIGDGAGGLPDPEAEFHQIQAQYVGASLAWMSDYLRLRAGIDLEET